MTQIEWKVLDKLYCAKLRKTLHLVINCGDVELSYIDDDGEHYQRGRDNVAQALMDIENKPKSRVFKCKAQAYNYIDRKVAL